MHWSVIIGWAVFVGILIVLLVGVVVAIKILNRSTSEDIATKYYLDELAAVRARANRLHDDLDRTLKQNHQYVLLLFEIATGRRNPFDVPPHLKKPETVVKAEQEASQNGR